MNGLPDEPLQLGDSVTYDELGDALHGVIVAQLDEDYVRVLWSDLGVPTTHRSYCLRREAASRTVA